MSPFLINEIKEIIHFYKLNTQITYSYYNSVLDEIKFKNDFIKNVNWYEISKYKNLSENFINEFKDYIIL